MGKKLFTMISYILVYVLAKFKGFIFSSKEIRVKVSIISD